MKTVFGWILIVVGALNLLALLLLLTDSQFDIFKYKGKFIFSAIFIGIGAWLLDSAKIKEKNRKKQIEE